MEIPLLIDFQISYGMDLYRSTIWRSPSDYKRKGNQSGVSASANYARLANSISWKVALPIGCVSRFILSTDVFKKILTVRDVVTLYEIS